MFIDPVDDLVLVLMCISGACFIYRELFKNGKLENVDFVFLEIECLVQYFHRLCCPKISFSFGFGSINVSGNR